MESALGDVRTYRDRAALIAGWSARLAEPFALISAVLVVGLLVGALIWISSTGGASGAGEATPT